MASLSTAAALPPGYTLRRGYPPIPTYCHLRAASGLIPKTPAQAAPVARNSWYGCYITFDKSAASTAEEGNNDSKNNKTTTTETSSVGTSANDGDDHAEDDKSREEGEIVAMGRIIGDGGWYFHVADMAVLPAHQRKGLGEAVLRHLLRQIWDNAPAGGSYVTLFAAGPGRRLYERHGFVEGPPEELKGVSWATGMSLPMGWEGTFTAD